MSDIYDDVVDVRDKKSCKIFATNNINFTIESDLIYDDQMVDLYKELAFLLDAIHAKGGGVLMADLKNDLIASIESKLQVQGASDKTL